MGGIAVLKPVTAVDVGGGGCEGVVWMSVLGGDVLYRGAVGSSCPVRVVGM